MSSGPFSPLACPFFFRALMQLEERKKKSVEFTPEKKAAIMTRGFFVRLSYFFILPGATTQSLSLSSSLFWIMYLKSKWQNFSKS